MRKRIAVVISVWLALSTGLLMPVYGQQMKAVQLPRPQLELKGSLMHALKDRKSTRAFSDKNLSSQTLSNLLWAAFGINRPASGKRTAPSAHNRQEIDVYVTTAQGAYRYDPKRNALLPVVSGDIRALAGTQSYVKDAALNLVYVADLKKMGGGDQASKMYLAAADTGFIGQNVYLYCATQGLATVFRAMIDRQKLAKALKLTPDQRITFAQTVGFPEFTK
ncbi:MAG: SagB/ThcOx family dehydrogenase [Deltaproteobacteria bacterium]